MLRTALASALFLISGAHAAETAEEAAGPGALPLLACAAAFVLTSTAGRKRR